MNDWNFGWYIIEKEKLSFCKFPTKFPGSTDNNKLSNRFGFERNKRWFNHKEHYTNVYLTLVILGAPESKFVEYLINCNAPEFHRVPKG